MRSSPVSPAKGAYPQSLDLPCTQRSERAAMLFKVLGDPTRLQILMIIAHNKDKAVCAVELSEALNISAPTVTHHMKKLTDANLVVRHKVGKWAYYEIVKSEYQRINKLVEAL
ncbi:MAG: metalloregulator ArsR/SmtB family transcription factor [Corynebacterium sp.]|uniref:ArsR/SmtB family transcription factor n=1 Tax=Corynebacterium sp. TaxID=1720 RepID=UPI0026DBC0BD|nr:metalloregulator ArsR/SmtB family transcription factor [Corynebacterium sp.]MDO4761116.1 metalloregulator ArsR/SmtB family transcription factor [Corynebacterium sp.]